MLSYFKKGNILRQIESEDTPTLLQETLSKCVDQVDEQGNIIEKATWQEITQEEYLALQPKEPEIDQKQVKISELKAKLAATDYQAIKYAEGQISDTEYEPIKNQRQAWRDEINQLEKEI